MRPNTYMIAIMPMHFFDHLLALPHRVRAYQNGASIFERDDPVVWYFAVRSGDARLIRRQEDGAEVVLQRAGAGAILAEASLSTDAYHCSAVAITSLKLLVFPKKSVLKLLAHDVAASRSFATHLASEVQNARRRAEIMALNRVADRLSAWLVWHDNILPPKGSWHQISDEIGVSKEALYRELAKRR